MKSEASAVWVAGLLLPDPAEKRLLKRIYAHFRKAIPAEYEKRGEDIW